MDINKEAAVQLMEELKCPERLIFVEGNTRVRADIHRAVEATVATFGKLDSVFANAGIHRANTLLDIADEELDLMIQTNIYGTVNTLREAIPHIVEAGGGTVVINASDQWFVGKAHSFAYGLTKGALGQITRSLSIDLGPRISVSMQCAREPSTHLWWIISSRSLPKRTIAPLTTIGVKRTRFMRAALWGAPKKWPR